MSEQTFVAEIEANKNAAEVSPLLATSETPASSLSVRLRGGFITNCELSSPTTGMRTNVLHGPDTTDTNTTTLAKIVASHTMVPVGPYEGVGGQHGFPRWSDYHEFELPEGEDGEKRFALQAKRSDYGLSLSRIFELTKNRITMRTTIASSVAGDEVTSIGEHLYFALEDGNLKGLTIKDRSLDELLGEGSEAQLMNDRTEDGTKDGTLYCPFDGEAIIHFPDGHDVKLSAMFEGETNYPLALWIWKKPGSSSICIEPIVGVENLDDDPRNGVTVPGYGNATLTTQIELL